MKSLQIIILTLHQNKQSVFFFLFFCLLCNFKLSANSKSQKLSADVETIKPIMIGDTIPEEIWKMPLKVVNSPSGKDTITLAEFRNCELIILDFWATWCVPCIKSIRHIDSLISIFDSSKVTLLPVSRYDDEKRMQSYIEKHEWKYPSVINNSTLDFVLMSSYRDYLGVIWIKDNKLFAVPKNASLTHENILYAITGQIEKMKVLNYEIR